ncbi:hypothetical protein STSP2_01777 [Anaerohalosphaera lusitana]|uniref:PEP-CTERM protein-sorting domain-containing protein n=1 Tax=Anaerohalosphaera lusitana TaxID=1936003 RepID=A0A1U9NL23_9BACT|nr:hypothetical protein [Anaerohalosphaera lusitana]AQT68609.1 hypothetical protein STSP2_01777 [Anaerohalosphaera lusitana]
MRFTAGLVLSLILVSGAAAAPVAVDFDSEFGAYHLLGEIVSGECEGMVPGLGIKSAVYTDGESYLYLYQLQNNAGSGVKRVTFAPFSDVSLDTLVGYLQTHDLADFQEDGLAPVLAETGDHERVSPFAGFSFRSYGQGSALLPNEHSAVLFVKSDRRPTMIDANVLFNDGNATGEVYGAVPEPMTILFLASGALMLRRRSN